MFDSDQLDERPVYRHIQIVARFDISGKPIFYPLFGCARTVSDAGLVLWDGGWADSQFIMEVGEFENVKDVYEDAYYYRESKTLHPESDQTFSYVLGGRLQFN